MSYAAARRPLHLLKRTDIAACVMGGAMLVSSIVVAEPAPVDLILAGIIVGFPLLGVVRFGLFSWAQVLAWIVICGFSFVAAAFAATPAVALKHQVITLFLALGAFMIAGYVKSETEARYHLIMRCFAVGCTFAALCAIVGQMSLIPGAHELFTTFGRGRGTFKDPNVLGAAVIPALAYVAWHALREPNRNMPLYYVAGMVLSLGLLISFSRGAWLSAGITLLFVAVFAGLRSRRRQDARRFISMSLAGGLGLVVVLVAALQTEPVQDLFAERASLSQDYDTGPHGRFAGQTKAMDLVLSNPMGIGALMFAPTHHHEAPHQVYLSMFLNAGWVGGLLYIVTVMTTLAAGIWGALRFGPFQGAFVVTTGSLLGIAIEGLVIDSDHWRHFFILLGLIWGLTDAQRPPIDHSKRRTDPPT